LSQTKCSRWWACRAIDDLSPAHGFTKERSVHDGKAKTYKARLVASDFQQEEDINYTKTCICC
jgi:hypothetical protein